MRYKRWDLTQLFLEFPHRPLSNYPRVGWPNIQYHIHIESVWKSPHEEAHPTISICIKVQQQLPQVSNKSQIKETSTNSNKGSNQSTSNIET